MGLKVRLARRAIADLNEIRVYLMERNPRGAERVRQRIEQAIATLADFPGIGRPTRLAGVSVATVLRYPYLVYHRLRPETQHPPYPPRRSRRPRPH